MKVTFNLDAFQHSRADYYACMAASPDESNSVWTGNIGGWVWHHRSLNRNQRLDLVGNLLTYEGERCPFIYDGLYERVMEILGDGPVEVVEYVTSDARLRWDENLEGFMWNRADWNTYRSHNTGKTCAIPERFADQSRVSFLLKMGREKAAYAEFPGSLVREVTSFIRACE